MTSRLRWRVYARGCLTGSYRSRKAADRAAAKLLGAELSGDIDVAAPTRQACDGMLVYVVARGRRHPYRVAHDERGLYLFPLLNDHKTAYYAYADTDTMSHGYHYGGEVFRSAVRVAQQLDADLREVT